MRHLCRALVIVILALPIYAQTIPLGDAEPNAPPKGFELALTGRGEAGRWQVVTDPTAEGGKAIAQTAADRTDHRFPLAIYSAISAADVEISTRFKTVAGKADQAGGLVVRFADANNYYVARANALEGNVRFYRVVRGDRQQLASADVKVTPGQWHQFSLRAKGTDFTVSYDGKTILTATDSTFAAAGKAGLWTKSDSVTYFDRIEIKAIY
jgi:hypothetical protein